MLYLGNNLEILKQLEPNSVDAVVTDPPYGLKFMGKQWDYDVPTKEFWQEVIRVLKSGGHVLSFGGTRTYHRMVVNIEDAGFEIRDQIMWLYGSGFPKSHNIGKKIKDWDGWGTALKPANEPIVLARKPISEKTVVDNVLKWGTGAINIDECRIPASAEDMGDCNRFKGAQNKNTIRKNMVDNKVDNFKERVDNGVNPHGRWPANLLLDETAAEMLDAQSGESISRPDKRKDQLHDGVNCYGKGWKRQPNNLNDSGGASRFFYVAKASKRERNAGLEGITNAHPTVKPIKLTEYLVKLITPPNGVVLDPFMGSGSTGLACKNLGVDFIGIELNKEYFEIAEKRINSVGQVTMPLS